MHRLPSTISTAGRGRSKAGFFLYLFAGLPLKHVVATGIVHPGTNGEICFMCYRA
jgi:hypothetical protein